MSVLIFTDGQRRTDLEAIVMKVKVSKLTLEQFEMHAKSFYLWSIEHSYTDCIGMLREAGLTDLQSLAVARYASMHSQAWKDAA
jgi:hypothetical protein